MTILAWVLLLAAALTPEQEAELRDLDAQIANSRQEKKRHEALAYKYADKAYLLQSNQKIQDAKRFYEMEEREREIAKYLQMEIDALEKRKSHILQNPE